MWGFYWASSKSLGLDIMHCSITRVWYLTTPVYRFTPVYLRAVDHLRGRSLGSVLHCDRVGFTTQYWRDSQRFTSSTTFFKFVSGRMRSRDVRNAKEHHEHPNCVLFEQFSVQKRHFFCTDRCSKRTPAFSASTWCQTKWCSVQAINQTVCCTHVCM